jgi:hypothetical protein
LRLYYIDNPQTPNQRKENKLAMEIAERVRLQRLEKYNRYQTLTPQQKEELDVFEAGKRSFYDFAAKAAENKKPATQREYRYTLNELKKAVPTLVRIH